MEQHLDQDWGYFVDIDSTSTSTDLQLKKEREKNSKKLYWENNHLDTIEEEYENATNTEEKNIKKEKILFRKCTPYDLFHLGTATMVTLSFGYCVFYLL